MVSPVEIKSRRKSHCRFGAMGPLVGGSVSFIDASLSARHRAGEDPGLVSSGEAGERAGGGEAGEASEVWERVFFGDWAAASKDDGLSVGAGEGVFCCVEDLVATIMKGDCGVTETFGDEWRGRVMRKFEGGVLGDVGIGERDSRRRR